MKRWIYTTIFILFLMAAQSLSAQKNQSQISGSVTDSATGEPLPFATVIVSDGSYIKHVTYADSNGSYGFEIALQECYTLKISYVGYANFQTFIDLKETGPKTLKHDVKMAGKRLVMKEVLITAFNNATWGCCCNGFYTIYCTNHRFKTDSIPPLIQSAPVKWYNMNVYPNPTANRVNLTANTAIEQPVQLQILDASGKLILQQQLDFRNQADYTFDLSPYRHGNYFFRMQYMGETHVEKVLKLR